MPLLLYILFVYLDYENKYMHTYLETGLSGVPVVHLIYTGIISGLFDNLKNLVCLYFLLYSYFVPFVNHHWPVRVSSGCYSTCYTLFYNSDVILEILIYILL